MTDQVGVLVDRAGKDREADLAVVVHCNNAHNGSCRFVAGEDDCAGED